MCSQADQVLRAQRPTEVLSTAACIVNQLIRCFGMMWASMIDSMNWSQTEQALLVGASNQDEECYNQVFYGSTGSQRFRNFRECDGGWCCRITGTTMSSRLAHCAPIGPFVALWNRWRGCFQVRDHV